MAAKLTQVAPFPFIGNSEAEMSFYDTKAATKDATTSKAPCEGRPLFCPFAHRTIPGQRPLIVEIAKRPYEH
jgi:hypothetical protein